VRTILSTNDNSVMVPASVALFYYAAHLAASLNRFPTFVLADASAELTMVLILAAARLTSK
ncbi:MAG: hypothetical protein OEU36_03495, partial [Gammaproteobacteria bacterium]|nr:hypothetical protein [Gammaproteobacteria bacterium]